MSEQQARHDAIRERVAEISEYREDRRRFAFKDVTYERYSEHVDDLIGFVHELLARASVPESKGE
jgi:hypothetical protein